MGRLSRVLGTGAWVQGCGYRVQGESRPGSCVLCPGSKSLEFGVVELGYRVAGTGYRGRVVLGPGSKSFRVWSSGSGGWGLVGFKRLGADGLDGGLVVGSGLGA